MEKEIPKERQARAILVVRSSIFCYTEKEI